MFVGIGILKNVIVRDIIGVYLNKILVFNLGNWIKGIKKLKYRMLRINGGLVILVFYYWL